MELKKTKKLCMSYPIDDPGVVLADVRFCFRILLRRYRLRTLCVPTREKRAFTIVDPNVWITESSRKQEIYLKNIPNNLRVIFTTFRSCNYKLPIETDRWSNIERCYRICSWCNKNTLDDEYHMLWNVRDLLYYTTN